MFRKDMIDNDIMRSKELIVQILEDIIQLKFRIYFFFGQSLILCLVLPQTKHVPFLISTMIPIKKNKSFYSDRHRLGNLLPSGLFDYIQNS